MRVVAYLAVVAALVVGGMACGGAKPAQEATEAQATCVAGVYSAELLPPAGGGTLAGEGRHTVSPSLQVMKALPPFWRDTMFSTAAKNP